MRRRLQPCGDDFHSDHLRSDLVTLRRSQVEELHRNVCGFSSDNHGLDLQKNTPAIEPQRDNSVCFKTCRGIRKRHKRPVGAEVSETDWEYLPVVPDERYTLTLHAVKDLRNVGNQRIEQVIP